LDPIICLNQPVIPVRREAIEGGLRPEETIEGKGERRKDGGGMRKKRHVLLN